MLSKLLIFLSISIASAGIAAGTLPLAATPKPTQPKKSERVPQSGMFPDGTTLIWMCEENMKGSVKILIITPDGLKLPAEVPCVSPTEKDI